MHATPVPVSKKRDMQSAWRGQTCSDVSDLRNASILAFSSASIFLDKSASGNNVTVTLRRAKAFFVTRGEESSYTRLKPKANGIH